MLSPIIDLRSDTVTHPTPAMWEAMRAAPLGDDVLGDEPTVQALEAKIAALLGKQAALYVPSGTMANQLAIRVVCGPGDEVIAHRDSHIIHYETGAPAALSGAMVTTVEGPAGTFDAAAVHAAVRSANVHHPRSRMLVAENTQNRGGGSVWPLEQFTAVAAAAHQHGLHVHLDGARLFNACVAAGYSAAQFTRDADSVSVCFSKGLGCPVGSVLVASADVIERARRFRKMFGGGMRQSGLLAGAAIWALDHHVARLADDHANAKRLAAGVQGLPGISLAIAPDKTPTNMVFMTLEPSVGTAHDFCERLRAHRVRMIAMDPQRVRAVTHLDVNAAGVDRAIEAVKALVRGA
ncbi:MAG: aminotransferase class I/II-fold pyridoxal phosphate-dependent enzyme [Phycisphaerae bacterium]|nr:aminotransferase class I/II-fold pyridoxal phosphate-dependent enzyme [Phycisphaerae bacterium]